MSMCVYIHMHIHMHIHLHIHIHIHTQCVCIHIYIYIYVSAEGEGVQIKTGALPSRSRPKRFTQQARPSIGLFCPEDRSSIEAKIPNHVDIEPIEPRPALRPDLPTS